MGFRDFSRGWVFSKGFRVKVDGGQVQEHVASLSITDLYSPKPKPCR